MRIPEGVEVEEQVGPKDGDYVVSVSLKSKHRCLHRVKSCFRVPGVHYRGFMNHGEEMPIDDEYDEICKDCWKTEGAAKEDEDDDESSSSSHAKDGEGPKA